MTGKITQIEEKMWKDKKLWNVRVDTVPDELTCWQHAIANKKVGDTVEFDIEEKNGKKRMKLAVPTQGGGTPRPFRSEKDNESIVRQTAGKIAGLLVASEIRVTPNYDVGSTLPRFDEIIDHIFGKLSTSAKETVEAFKEDAKTLFTGSEIQRELFDVAQQIDEAKRSDVLIALTTFKRKGTDDIVPGTDQITSLSEARCGVTIKRLKEYIEKCPKSVQCGEMHYNSSDGIVQCKILSGIPCFYVDEEMVA